MMLKGNGARKDLSLEVERTGRDVNFPLFLPLFFLFLFFFSLVFFIWSKRTYHRY